MLRVFPISLNGAACHWLRNEPARSIKTWEDLKTKFLNKYCPPAPTAKKMEEINNFQQEPAKTITKQSMKDTLSKFMSESTKRHEEKSNMIKQIRASMDAAIRNQGASIKTLEIQIGQMSKEKDPGSFTLPCYINNVCFDNVVSDLGASVSGMPLSTYLNLGLGKLAHSKLTVELPDRTVKYPIGIAENMLVGRPFLSTAHAKIDVFKRKITLRLGDEKIIFESVKPTSSLIKMVYMLSLRERMELDLKARLMGETLVLNRSLELLFGDYIELNDLNEPLELRRDQDNNLMPTIEEGELINAPMHDLVDSRNDEHNTGIDDYPSDCDHDKKIRIDCAHNLMFSCMIGFQFVHVNFILILYVNVMSIKFHNSIMKDKLDYHRNNVVGALMNVPIFPGTFSVVKDFAVLEDIDAYHDEIMGDFIVGEPFLRETGIKERRFEGMITLYKGDEEVTYQMV
nr:hypothetical protein [Tanacetum cinerariifolium]